MFVNTTDLGKMVGLLKQMGGDSAQNIPNTDTTISLAGIADSISGLTSEQRKLINQGTMRLTVNMQDEKLLIKLSLPFKKLSDIQSLKEALPEISEATLKKLPGTDQMSPGTGDNDSTKIKTFDNFYDMTFTDKLITKTLNKTKYDQGKSGDYMKSVQQMSDMGSPITANYIINLPRPAKKVEGKAVKLSDDKKKVSLTVTSDDFFNDPTKFEYRIEY